MSQKIVWLAMATIASTIIGLASKAQAVSINYRTSEVGVSQKGTTSFSKAGDGVTIPAKSINSANDPALGVWEGLANNTDQFASIFNANDDDLSQIAFVDDEMVALSLDEESLASFTLPTSEGYIVQVVASESDSMADYEPVPEPITILGSLTAIGVGVFLKRKYSPNNQIENKPS